MDMLASPHRPRRRQKQPPFVGLSLRQAYAKRQQQLIDEYLAELGGEPGAARTALVRRCATLSIELERIEDIFASGVEVSPSDVAAYSRSAGNLRRILDVLGLVSKPRAA